MNTKRMLIVSDLHAGHRSALTHPSFSPPVPEDADRYLKKFAQEREALWKWTQDAMKPFRRNGFDYGLCLGDAIDGRGERSGGTELLTSNRFEQCDMAAAVLKSFPVKNKSWYMVRGTPYHVGTEEDWENDVAVKIGAVKIEEEAHFEINGIQVAAKHFIGLTSSPASRFTALSNAQIKQMLWAAHGQQPQANLILRGHIHRCVNIGDIALNFQAWVCPSLQGLGTRYGIRQLDGLPVLFGFLVLTVVSEHDWGVSPHVAPLSLQPAQVSVL